MFEGFGFPPAGAADAFEGDAPPDELLLLLLLLLLLPLPPHFFAPPPPPPLPPSPPLCCRIQGGSECASEPAAETLPPLAVTRWAPPRVERNPAPDDDDDDDDEDAPDAPAPPPTRAPNGLLFFSPPPAPAPASPPPMLAAESSLCACSFEPNDLGFAPSVAPRWWAWISRSAAFSAPVSACGFALPATTLSLRSGEHRQQGQSVGERQRRKESAREREREKEREREE